MFYFVGVQVEPSSPASEALQLILADPNIDSKEHFIQYLIYISHKTSFDHIISDFLKTRYTYVKRNTNRFNHVFLIWAVTCVDVLKAV